MNVDLDKLVSVAQIRGGDDGETAELQEMAERARSYFSSHDWCRSIEEEYFGFGVGKVVAVFLFQTRMTSGDEEWLWVVEGDLPSAYMVTD